MTRTLYRFKISFYVLIYRAALLLPYVFGTSIAARNRETLIDSSKMEVRSMYSHYSNPVNCSRNQLQVSELLSCFAIGELRRNMAPNEHKGEMSLERNMIGHRTRSLTESPSGFSSWFLKFSVPIAKYTSAAPRSRLIASNEQSCFRNNVSYLFALGRNTRSTSVA